MLTKTHSSNSFLSWRLPCCADRRSSMACQNNVFKIIEFDEKQLKFAANFRHNCLKTLFAKRKTWSRRAEMSSASVPPSQRPLPPTLSVVVSGRINSPNRTCELSRQKKFATETAQMTTSFAKTHLSENLGVGEFLAEHLALRSCVSLQLLKSGARKNV